MSADGEKALAAFGGCVGLTGLFVAMLVVGSVADGFVLLRLWGWFVLPHFAAPTLTLAQMIGFALCVRALRPVAVDDPESDDKWKPLKRLAVRIVVHPALTLLMGYVVSRYV